MSSGNIEDLSEVTVLIPVLNEEKAIGFVLDELVSTGIPRENVLVIDGGSTDKTVLIATTRGFKVIPQEGRGKSDALKTGIKYVNTPYVVVMDGDYTYPAKYIQLLHETAREKGYDLVIGKRIYRHGSQGVLFFLGNKMITLIFNMLFGVKITDVLSGMYLAKTDKLRELSYEMKGFSIEVEIVSHFSNLGSVAEVPIEYRQRLDPSAKKLKVRHGFLIALDMLRLTWRYNPAFLIFSLGALLLIPGLVLGAWVAYRYFFMGITHHIRGLAAILLTAVGLQSLILAIMALYVKRIELRVHRKLDEIFRLIKRRNHGGVESR